VAQRLLLADGGSSSHEPGESVVEPPPRPLDTPLTGDLQLVVDGLPEEPEWDPRVVIAQGTARREPELVLSPLTQDVEVKFVRMLPRAVPARSRDPGKPR
jgi:hypothetical protein